MLELLNIYKWSLIASVILSGGLANLGIHLAARDRAMQTICLGQGAMLGVLLGIAIVPLLGEHRILDQFFPLLTALTASWLTFAVSQSYLRRGLTSANSHFGSLFALLLALGYLTSTLFPALESHMAQRYFGDIATMSDPEAYLVIGLGLAAIVGLGLFHRRFIEQSFDIAIYGELHAPGRRTSVFFEALVLLCLSFSVQTVGYLFTLACLFIPTTLSARYLRGGLTMHATYSMILAPSATLGGFALSLSISTLPTVPTIIITMMLAGWLGILGIKLFERLSRADVRSSLG